MSNGYGGIDTKRPLSSGRYCTCLPRYLIGKLLKSVFEPIANRMEAIWRRVCCIQYLQTDWTILGALAKLRKESYSFVMSVRPSVTIEQLGSH